MRALGAIALFCAAVLAACGPSTNSGECVVCGDETCVDREIDPNNCGECGTVCGASQQCVAGECTSGAESCDPGATEACYEGPPSTDGVAACHGGTRRCADNGYWGACEGQVLPEQDVCGNGVDEDCDGTADNATDEDGDGYTNCDGDCCDSTAEGCQSPELVNPGAFEAPGNQLDDDCDGQVDNVNSATCDENLVSNTTNIIDYAKAIDICREALDGGWGVVSARILETDGSSHTKPNQRAIRDNFGATQVQNGARMAVISTANAADSNDTNPGPAAWVSTQHNTTAPFPSDFLQANGGQLPNAPDCPDPLGSVAYDPVMLELKIKAPTNAKSFSMRVNMMSAEFPEYTCTQYNDFFVVLLDSGWTGDPANPADKNLAFYVDGNNQRYPVGVNLAYGDTGLFTVCVDGDTGCTLGGVAGEITTCNSASELAGTGLETVDNACGTTGQLSGGGTGWLTTSGNVVGGEEFTLRIALWDTSDGRYDSVALIDNFQWSIEPSEPGTVIDVD